MIRLIIFFMLFPIVVLANNQTVYYEPKTVELIGVLKTLKFPGPPNYTNIKNGDKAETGSYLLLDKPVDVEVSPAAKNSTDNPPERNVSLIQLVVTEKNFWRQIKEGNKIRITGTLFHALTGHHHARVLINVKKIDVLSHQSGQDNKQQLTPEDRQFLKQQHVEND
ncbi:DUF4431 domain-containing protein [Legionella cherrii]|uniref:DUF4431 domain-containing protein n=1 Tax=Legionella cherrii TaxID=28084 RepID=A0A0W0SFR7_9GAMM|nr:DUF4431 domain-containing protein [Legionella cherrii]KTC82296.1 hypothetical protein Lche_0560 [Legionella cherrii]VEB32705.1 Uncharacterised protein [Legionella cherrii]